MQKNERVELQGRWDALNALVQKGLAQVVLIAEDGEPFYRLASRITDVRIIASKKE